MSVQKLPLSAKDIKKLWAQNRSINYFLLLFWLLLIGLWMFFAEKQNSNVAFIVFAFVLLLMSFISNWLTFACIKKGDKIKYTGLIEHVSVSEGVFEAQNVFFNEEKKILHVEMSMAAKRLAKKSSTNLFKIYVNQNTPLAVTFQEFIQYRIADEIEVEYITTYNRLLSVKSIKNTPKRETNGWKMVVECLHS